jgi:hypothetical protein
VNWLVFAAAAWVFAGVEKGLRDALTLGQSGITPSFAFVLMTFIAMTAPRATVLWSSVALGLVMDLIFEVPLKQGTGTVTIPGPHVLAFALGCQLILSMRGLMIRRNPLTLGFLACMGALVSNTTLVTIFTLRNMLGAGLAWETRHELLAGLGSAPYTGVIAIALAFVLFPLAGPLGLPNQQQRRFAVRH